MELGESIRIYFVHRIQSRRPIDPLRCRGWEIGTDPPSVEHLGRLRHAKSVRCFALLGVGVVRCNKRKRNMIVKCPIDWSSSIRKSPWNRARQIHLTCYRFGQWNTLETWYATTDAALFLGEKRERERDQGLRTTMRWKVGWGSRVDLGANRHHQ